MSQFTPAAIIVARVAMTEAVATSIGAKTPNMPIDVNTAKAPPAGVNAPYIHDWKPAASDPYIYTRVRNGDFFYREK